MGDSMVTRSNEIVWLDGRETVTVTQLCRTCALTAAEVDELVSYGVLAPLAPPPAEALFSAEWVMPLRQAARLRRDLDLDLFTVAILLGYLGRIDALESELRSLHARRPDSGSSPG